jgi:HEAT repeat protein
MYSFREVCAKPQAAEMRCLLILSLLLFVSGCTGSRSTDDWLQQLKDPDVVKRRQAIRELGDRTADAERVAPALAEALQDENRYVRHDAAITLAKLGTAAKQGVPALRTALKDKERSVRKAAAQALKKINAKETSKAAEGVGG